MCLWRNHNASDYESGDCRFESCQTRWLLTTQKYLQNSLNITEKDDFKLKVLHYTVLL